MFKSGLKTINMTLEGETHLANLWVPKKLMAKIGGA